jgi:Domain of unknown function (DUF4465)
VSLTNLSAETNQQGSRPRRTVVDFEDLSLAPSSFNNGSDGSGGFTSRNTFFNNSYDSSFDSWSGWSYSNTTDTTTPGVSNQYSAYTGSGFRGSSNYGVAYSFNPGDATIDLPDGSSPNSLRITNTTYAALSMLNGDQFAKKFGGESGNDPDFFKLTIEGEDASNNSVGTVDFYLADYRFADNSKDYIVDSWERVDLSSLKGATELSLEFTSSDNDPQFGLNTPAYAAIDNLVLNSSKSAQGKDSLLDSTGEYDTQLVGENNEDPLLNNSNDGTQADLSTEEMNYDLTSGVYSDSIIYDGYTQSDDLINGDSMIDFGQSEVTSDVV